MHEGKLTEPLDCFAHPFWDEVREPRARPRRWRCAGRASSARRCCPMGELEYTGIVETLAALQSRFSVRPPAVEKAAA